MNQKVYLCSFGDSRLCLSSFRFYQEAKELRVFDEIFLYNETNLDLSFREQMKDKIYLGGGQISRGYGYWCWKPQIILQTLRQIRDNDILIYADIGCSFDKKGREVLLEQIAEVDKNEMMSIDLLEHKAKTWTKSDIFAHFGVLNNPKITDTSHYNHIYEKTPKTLEIIQKWLDCFVNHFDLVADSPSSLPRLLSFYFFLFSKTTQIALFLAFIFSFEYGLISVDFFLFGNF
ncbi:hypothetical protein [Helicobacter fennelliae]|uniref:hypothetical protein n=1 Tax=Helicobacter fennelliae TaxID=215 RepID=UPI001B31DF6C|nr:hypothetical protein [Helicobacter fennelliae]